jgi:hypothetical protein
MNRLESPIEINIGVVDETSVAVDLTSNNGRKGEERRRPILGVNGLHCVYAIMHK